MSNELVLVDLSSIAYPIWHQSSTEPDPDHTATQIVARVRAITTGKPYAAICCDSGRSFRKDIADSYKANRPQAEAPLMHQIFLARERLLADGFPVWAVKGFEADDLIAAATMRALASDGLDVLIVSADKDLLQLVGDRVRAMSVRDGSILGADEVKAKFGVTPAQMCDYLCLVGDTSDNVKGAKGIGPKRAADILAQFGTLDAVYKALDEAMGRPIGLPTVVEMSLRAFKADLEITRQLITLRTDVEIPFEEISAERVSKDAAMFGIGEEPMMTTEIPEADSRAVQPHIEAPRVDAAQGEANGLSGSNGGAVTATPVNGSASTQNLNVGMVVRSADVLAPPPAEWEKQLEPRSIYEAIDLAKHMYASKLFSAYGTPQGVLSTVMAGRELGIPAQASLRVFHVIEGKPSMSADLIRGLVIRSAQCEYFRIKSRSAQAATWVTKRRGDPEVELTYTIEEGRQAWQKDQKGWDASAWGKRPANMVTKTASSELARLVYPDVVANMYSIEELSGEERG